jgi:hypothetical protein
MPPVNAQAPPRDGACDVDRYDSLAELALDLRSSWNHATDPVWHRLDPVLWNLTNNPWVVLQTVSRDKLREAMADGAFRKTVDDLLHARRQAPKSLRGFRRRIRTPPSLIARNRRGSNPATPGGSTEARHWTTAAEADWQLSRPYRLTPPNSGTPEEEVASLAVLNDIQRLRRCPHRHSTAQ